MFHKIFDSRQNFLKIGLVEEKIQLTKNKILEQGRNDLHIIYELQRYIFIRECIARRVFNRWSIKHPERSIPDFKEVFDRHLGQCGILLTIANVDPTDDADDFNLTQEQ